MARKAFVWGSNGPPGAEQLKYALQDEQRFKQVLESPKYGFVVSSPSQRYDPYLIKKELDAFAKACVKEDTVIFFFSGHGDLLDGRLMLVLDQTLWGDETTYLAASWLTGARDLCKADNRLIILDCCHAGGAIGAKKAPLEMEEFGLQSKTEMMLLASRRLELAREFDRLEGSFLTSGIVAFCRG